MDLSKLIYLSTQQHSIPKAASPVSSRLTSSSSSSSSSLSLHSPPVISSPKTDHHHYNHHHQIEVKTEDQGLIDLSLSTGASSHHQPSSLHHHHRRAHLLFSPETGVATTSPAASSSSLSSTSTTSTNSSVVHVPASVADAAAAVASTLSTAVHPSASATITTTNTTTSSSSASQLEHVLQRYQQAATMTLNGPDWYAFSRSIAVASQPVSSVANNNNNITDAAALLELTKSRNIPAAGDTLDLRIAPARREQVPASSSTTTNQSANPSKDSPPYASNFFTHPPPFPIQQPPLLTPPDQDNCERSETLIQGENIACFNIGGEKRLCFPQVMNIVLEGFDYTEIIEAIQDLQIYSATCSTEQMDVLKRFGDIPRIAPSCGLITKTDAHRLCSTLLGPTTITKVNFSTLPCVAIYHECFGRTTGLYAPALYEAETSLCIQCDDCSGAFSPPGFVSHTHRGRSENRTCHWGFDPANWRHYIQPVEDCLYDDRQHLGAPEQLVPVCSGGRKAFKASLKVAAASLRPEELAKYEGAYNNKAVVGVRKILKEMKNKWGVPAGAGVNGAAFGHRRTHSISATSASSAKRKHENIKESTTRSESPSVVANRLYRSSSDGMSHSSKRFKTSSESSDPLATLAAFQSQLGSNFSSLLPFINGNGQGQVIQSPQSTTRAQVPSPSAPSVAPPPPPPPQYSSHLLANLLSGSNATAAAVSAATSATAPPPSTAASPDLASSLFKSSPLSFLFSDPKTASTFNALLKDPTALAAILSQPGAALAYPQLFFTAPEQLSVANNGSNASNANNPTTVAQLLNQNYRSQVEAAERAKNLESFLEQHQSNAAAAAAAQQQQQHANSTMKSAATDYPMIYEHLTKAMNSSLASGEKTTVASILNGTSGTVGSPSSAFTSMTSKNTAAAASSSSLANSQLAMDNLLNFKSSGSGSGKAAPSSGSTVASVLQKMDPFENHHKAEKYSGPLGLHNNGGGGCSVASIINESFIKKTLMDTEVGIKKEVVGIKEKPKMVVPFNQLEDDYKSLIEDHVEKLKLRLTDAKLTTLRDHLLSVDKMCTDEISTLANRQTSTFKTKLFLTLFQLIDLLVLDSAAKDSTSASASASSPSANRRLSTESKNSTEEEIVVDDDSNDSVPTPVIVKMEHDTGIFKLERNSPEISMATAAAAAAAAPVKTIVLSPRSSGHHQSSPQSPPSRRLSPIPTPPASSLNGTGTSFPATAISSSSSSSASSGASSPAHHNNNHNQQPNHSSHQEYLHAISTAINTLSKSSNGTSCSLRMTADSRSPLHHLVVGGRENGSNGADTAKLLLTTGGSPN